MPVAMRAYCGTEVIKRLSILQAAGTSNGEQPGHSDFTSHTAASEAGLAPLHGAPESPLGSIVGRFHAVVAEKGKEPFEVFQQRTGEVADTLSGQST